MRYKKLIEKYPFIEEDFKVKCNFKDAPIYAKHKKYKNIYCVIFCINSEKEHMKENLYVTDVCFKKKKSFFSPQYDDIFYDDLYELQFTNHFDIIKTKFNETNLIKVKVFNKDDLSITTTITSDASFFEPYEASHHHSMSLGFENIDHLHYVSIDGPAVQTVDADGKIINKMYVVNGIKLNEFEFEVFKASGKKNFYSRGAN